MLTKEGAAAGRGGLVSTIYVTLGELLFVIAALSISDIENFKKINANLL